MDRILTSFPIPLKKQNQAMISFQRMPLEKADLDLIKKWIDLMSDNLTEGEVYKEELTDTPT